MTPEERAAYARTLMGYGLGPTTERTRAGLPNAELSASPEIVGDSHGLPSRDAGLTAAEHIPSLAAEMTGVPAVMRGAGNIARGYQEGDILRGAAGAGEMALGVMPGASLTAPGRAALARVLSSPGKALGATTAAAAPMLGVDAREAAAGSTEKARAAVEADPQVAQLRARLQELQGEHQRILSTPIRGLNKASADASRERMAAPIAKELEALPGRIRAAEQAAEQGWRENAPFRDRYPGVAETLLYGGAAAAAGLPFANTLKARIADRYVYQPAISRQADRVETSLRGGTTEPGMLGRMMGRQAETVKPNQAQFETERDTLARMLRSREAREPSHLGQIAGGTGIMMEARMIPEEIDAIAFPPDHPTRDQALKSLTSPSYYASGVVPSLLGGALPAHVGNTAGRLMTRGERPDMDRARGLAEVLWKGKAPDPSPQPTRMGRIQDAATDRLVRILRGNEPPPAGPAGTPRFPSGPDGAPPGLPGAGPQGGGTPPLPSPTPSPSPPPAGPPVPAPLPGPGNQPPPGSGLGGEMQPRIRSSDTIPYDEAHGTIARGVLEGQIARGNIPDALETRAAVAEAIRRAGLTAPHASELTRKSNATNTVMRSAAGEEPEAQRRILAGILGRPGFLSVPAAVSAGAALTSEPSREDLARALLAY